MSKVSPAIQWCIDKVEEAKKYTDKLPDINYKKKKKYVPKGMTLTYHEYSLGRGWMKNGTITWRYN